MEKKVYLSPKIEVLYVAVEQGFAASSTFNGSPGFGSGFSDESDWG